MLTSLKQKNTCQELAFLPAALEIQETPPSPAGRAILHTIMIFFIIGVVWAFVGKVDIVAVAQGKIIPSGHIKVIQPLELGTVHAIHVTEGQAVKQGDILIELDPSAIVADRTRLEKELQTTTRQAERLQLLAEWTDPGTEATDTRRPVSAVLDSVLRTQWREYQERLGSLLSEQARRRAEKRTVLQQVAKLEAILPIIEQRAAGQKRLADNKMLPEQDYLRTEQDRLESFHDLQTQRLRVNEIVEAVNEIRTRLAHAKTEFRRQILENLEEVDRNVTTVRQELVKARTRADAHILTAPVDGVVQQLAVHTVGGIVTPAQKLMVIVPASATLEVEALVENKDIGFVEEGQPAEIKLEAFPFTKYGAIAGTIADLSNDAVAIEAKGLAYTARVLMAQSAIQVNNRRVDLAPGMAVTVEVKTGKRRLIEYFLSPLLRYRDESVRER